MLEAARVAALLNGQSGSFNLQSSGLGGTGLVGGSLAGLGTASGGLNLNLGPLPQASQQQQQQQQLGDQLALLSQFPASLFPQYNGGAEQLRNVGKTRSSDSRSSSAYASRHQAAEQRRRTRINERLELLRKLVPHAERANTAVFLEEVIKYIEALKRRTLELEGALEAATGKPVPKSLAMPMPTGGLSSSTPEPADNQDPSPRQPSGSAPGAKRSSAQQLGGVQAAAAASPSPPSASLLAGLSQVAAAAAEQDALAQQELQPPQGQAQQSDLLDPPPQLQLPPLQGPTVTQLSQLQQAQAALFPHSHSGALSSLQGGASAAALTLSQLAGLSGPSHSSHLPPHVSHSLLPSSAHHHHHSHHSGGGGSGLHGGHHHSVHHHSVAAQLSELQKLQAMQTLQQQGSRASAAAPPFHPINNKAFLHFNEDLFGGLKPELGGGGIVRGGGGAAAAPTTSAATTTTQLTSVQLPTDSNTLLALTAETARKTASGSPATSEESGVPLKKRKVLML